MAFIKRLGWYLVGLSIGLIFLAVFLKKKSEETGTSFCYFPNCRVLKELRSKPVSLDNYDGITLDSTLINAYLTDGDVRFKESNTRAQPCAIYVVRHEYEGKSGRLQLANCSDTVRIMAFSAH